MKIYKKLVLNLKNELMKCWTIIILSCLSINIFANEDNKQLELKTTKAQIQFNAKEYENALELLTEVFDNNPHYIPGLELQALIFETQGKALKALNSIRKIALSHRKSGKGTKSGEFLASIFQYSQAAIRLIPLIQDDKKRDRHTFYTTQYLTHCIKYNFFPNHARLTLIQLSSLKQTHLRTLKGLKLMRKNKVDKALLPYLYFYEGLAHIGQGNQEMGNSRLYLSHLLLRKFQPAEAEELKKNLPSFYQDGFNGSFGASRAVDTNVSYSSDSSITDNRSPKRGSQNILDLRLNYNKQSKARWRFKANTDINYTKQANARYTDYTSANFNFGGKANYIWKRDKSFYIDYDHNMYHLNKEVTDDEYELKRYTKSMESTMGFNKYFLKGKLDIAFAYTDTNNYRSPSLSLYNYSFATSYQLYRENRYFSPYLKLEVGKSVYADTPSYDQDIYSLYLSNSFLLMYSITATAYIQIDYSPYSEASGAEKLLLPGGSLQMPIFSTFVGNLSFYYLYNKFTGENNYSVSKSNGSIGLTYYF